ncbi:MAG: toll/interleukin-1 receptor domain-containing protein, partial [Gemmatimonadaceae bacterium]
MTGSRDKIFISYRRDDSSGHVGRLHDALVQQLGAASVFMDIDSIAPGADFVQVLQYSLEQAAVVVVVMGSRWMGPRPDGTRRIDDPNDFVRLEVAKALADPNVRVLPVLVNRAEMVSEESLPDELKPLA